MTKIFYFSGTGNSFVTAKRIGEIIGAEVLPLTRVLKQNFDDKIIGFVLPVYCSDIPRLATKIIRQMNISKDAYVFTVVTCAGGRGRAVNRTYELLKDKGRKLAYGNWVVLPSNFIVMGTQAKKREKMFEEYEDEIKVIINNIKNRLSNGEEFKKKPNNLLIDWSWKLSNTLLKLDKKEVDTNICIDCGLCIKICPVGNIEKVQNKYVFRDWCENCSACIQWCPKRAITFGGRKPDIKSAYVHPDTDIKSIISQKN